MVWLPAPGGAFLGTTPHSPDLDRDRAQRRAFELPSQPADGHIAVALTLKPGESKVVALHTAPADRIARRKAAYPLVCDARLLGRGDEAVWESHRAAYSIRNGKVEAWGKLSSRGILGQERIPLAAFDLPPGGGPPEIAAVALRPPWFAPANNPSREKDGSQPWRARRRSASPCEPIPPPPARPTTSSRRQAGAAATCSLCWGTASRSPAASGSARRLSDPYDQRNYVQVDARVGLPILWWAFQQTGQTRYCGSRTSAICAYGLLRMSELETDPKLARRYRDLGRRLAEALIDRCLTPAEMLSQTTYAKPAEGDFMWDNFSLVRAFCWFKTKGLSRSPWGWAFTLPPRFRAA